MPGYVCQGMFARVCLPGYVCQGMFARVCLPGYVLGFVGNPDFPLKVMNYI